MIVFIAREVLGFLRFNRWANILQLQTYLLFPKKSNFQLIPRQFFCQFKRNGQLNTVMVFI